MEASPSKATTIDGIMAEESGLEDLWSELYALKNLYRLLHITSGDDSRDCLDEKSRDVLKKLLDGATNQALQSQAKIVCYTPEPPQTSEKPENTLGPVASKAENTEPKISTKEEVKTPEKLQKCTPISSKQETAESTKSNNPPAKAVPKQLKREPELHQKTEPKFICKRCPSVNRRALSRQNSRKLTVSDKRLALHHPHHHQDRESLKPRTGNRINGKNQATVVNAERQDERVKPQPNKGELLAIVPAEKRARVEPSGPLGRSSMDRTRVVGRIDRELTHSKHSDTSIGARQHNSKPPSRLGSLRSRDQASLVWKERPREKTSRSGGSRSKPPGRLGSCEDRNRITDHENSSIYVAPRKTPPRMKREQIDPHPKIHPAAVPARMKSIRYSSSSQTTRSSSFSPRRHRVTRRVDPTAKQPPRRMPSQPRNAGPPRRPEKAPEEKQEEGRLKRFRNKLAVIFHHHHHHHHHLHDGGPVEAGERGGARRHRSPWAYLRSAVGHTSKGKGNELAKAPARLPAQQRQHGYLYAMIEGLIQHVRGMRRRKSAKIGGRVKQRNKLRWWQRFRRRRGGLRLANKKAPRLRLGFNRSQSRNNRNKNR